MPLLPQTRSSRRRAAAAVIAILAIIALLATFQHWRARRCCVPMQSVVTPVADEPIAFDSARARAADEFGARLLALVARGNAADNIFISPLSAQLALSIVYNGAAGDTRRAIARALGVGAAGLDDFNHANAALIRHLIANRDVTLELANSLWGRSDVPFAPGFIQRARTDYGAEVASLELGSTSAMDRINRWASDHTHGRIPSILDRPSDGLLVLLSAVYFKGSWSTPFDKSLTTDRPFHLVTGAAVPRPMMLRTDWYGYARGRNFQALRLPYKGDSLSMYVLLPDSGVAVSALNAQLGSAAAATWRDMKSTQLNLALPRFTLEYGVDLMEPLAGLGMGVALDAKRADFSQMVSAEYIARQRLFISGAKQKTFVAVNEEGTEAAAVTKVEMFDTAVAPEYQPKDFIVDRPFLVVIRDDASGAVLFVGRVMDPK